ncbi:MAG: helicase RepA family protein [Akkermansiaceae bacterium]
MSEATLPKDARGILNTAGREALRAAVMNAEPIVGSPIGGPSPEPFPITRAGEMSGIAEAADFVEGLLTEGGASVVYGPSNTGKSFWVLDLAAAVATGSDFRDELEVDAGAVVYLALEGSHGARNRIAALKQAGKLPEAAPFFLCFAPVSLLETGHAGRMAETVKQAAKQSAMPCRLVIIDTLARGMAGGDENSGQDMTRAVQAVDLIRAATGAHVLIVHHCGKDEARGARGHSSLRAAVDTEIEVSRPEGETISTVRVTKQRDMPPGEPLPFSLKVITLGTDRRGKPITSCVVHHESSVMAANRTKLGRKPEVNPETLLTFLPMPTIAAWRKAADEADGTPKSTFYRSLATLKTRGAVMQGEDGTWNRSEPTQPQGFPRVPE